MSAYFVRSRLGCACLRLPDSNMFVTDHDSFMIGDLWGLTLRFPRSFKHPYSGDVTR